MKNPKFIRLAYIGGPFLSFSVLPSALLLAYGVMFWSYRYGGESPPMPPLSR